MSDLYRVFDFGHESYPAGFSLTESLQDMLNFEGAIYEDGLELLTVKRCLNFQKNILKDAIEVVNAAEFYLNIHPTLKPYLEGLLKIVKKIYRNTRAPSRATELPDNVRLHNADSKIAWLNLLYSAISIELNQYHNRDISQHLYNEIESIRNHIRIAEYLRDLLAYRNFENQPTLEAAMTPGYWLYNMKPVVMTAGSARNITDNQLNQYTRALTLGTYTVRSHVSSRSDIRVFVLSSIMEAIEATSEEFVPVVANDQGLEISYLELTRRNLDRIKEKLIIKVNDRRLEVGLSLAINEEIQAIHRHMQTIVIQKMLIAENRSKCLAICGAHFPVESLYTAVLNNNNFSITNTGSELYEPIRLPAASLTGFTNNNVNRWEVITSDRGHVVGISLNGKNLNAASVNVRSEPGSVMRLNIEVVITPGQDVLSISGGGLNDNAIGEKSSVRYERHVDF